MSTKLIPSSKTTRRPFVASATFFALLAFGAMAAGPAKAPLLLDDYSDPKNNKHGVERLLINDKEAGSSSQATQKCENGVLTVKGDLVSFGMASDTFAYEVDEIGFY